MMRSSPSSSSTKKNSSPSPGTIRRLSALSRISSSSTSSSPSMDALKLPLLMHSIDTTSTRISRGTRSGNHKTSSSTNSSSVNNHKSMTINKDVMEIGIALLAWYLVGVVAICTTKLLLSTPLEDGGVPSPLVLTFQQMSLGSCVLGLFLLIKGRFSNNNGSGIQSWPKEENSKTSSSSSSNGINNNFSFVVLQHIDYLLLAGLFNGLDFLASNTSFRHSSASFVETIKASEPITTTALAIWWGIDRLNNKSETLALVVLISGVLISTYANAASSGSSTSSTSTTTISLQDSIKTCLTVMTANLCFAFRAMAQKLLRSTVPSTPPHTPTTGTQQQQHLDDFNLLFRMQQTGALSLLVPVLLFQRYTLVGLVLERRDIQVLRYYVGLSLVNAIAFATYSCASCFVLSKISVVQHSGFGCLRRLFAIIVTSITFGVPISSLGIVGILMSLIGFATFTHYRFLQQQQGQQKQQQQQQQGQYQHKNNGVSSSRRGSHGRNGVGRNDSSSTTDSSSSSSSSSEEV